MKHKSLAVVTGLLLAAAFSLQPVNAARYGPVKNNETLWDIASHYRSSYDISVAEMMAAIHAKNPGAFVGGDIRLLKKGAYLEIPALPGEPATTPAQQPAAVQPEQPASQSTGEPAQPAGQASLQAEINTLRAQLKEEQGLAAGLAEQLKQLQSQQQSSAAAPADNQQVAKLQSDLLVKLQTELADLKQQLQQKDARIAELQSAAAEVSKPSAGNGADTKQADAAMQAELAELKKLLEQRDTHIQHLQASLREASISIKRQFAENQALHTQLKAIQPDTTLAAPEPPAEPGTSAPPSLTLAGVEEGKPAEPTPAEGKQVFVDQVSPDTTVADSTPPPEKKPVSLQNMLEKQVAGNGAESLGADTGLPTPSRVAVAVALISLMFVLALVWRSFSQQRALRQEEARLRAALGSDAA